VPRRSVIPTIRANLGRKADRSVVYHSLRHGAATDHFHYGWRFPLGTPAERIAVDDLQTLGCWASEKAAHIYLHSPMLDVDVPAP